MPPCVGRAAGVILPKAEDGDKVPDRQIWFPVQPAKYGCVVEKSAPGSHGNKHSHRLQPPVLKNLSTKGGSTLGLKSCKASRCLLLGGEFTKGSFVAPNHKLALLVAHFISAIAAIWAYLLQHVSLLPRRLHLKFPTSFSNALKQINFKSHLRNIITVGEMDRFGFTFESVGNNKRFFSKLRPLKKSIHILLSCYLRSYTSWLPITVNPDFVFFFKPGMTSK